VDHLPQRTDREVVESSAGQGVRFPAELREKLERFWNGAAKLAPAKDRAGTSYFSLPRSHVISETSPRLALAGTA
jgi:hypothetical protein